MPPAPTDPPVASSLDVKPAARILSWFLPAYVIAFGIAVIFYHSPLAMVGGNELGWDRAFFAAANGLTLTGFQSFANPSHYQPAGQWMTFALLLAGTQLTLIAAGLASVKILRLRYSRTQVIAASLTLQLLVLLAGAVFLAEPTHPLSGAFNTAAAFANCGLRLGEIPSAVSPQAQLLLLPLAVLGGLGLPVLLELVDWVRGQSSPGWHGRTALTLTAAAYLVSLILFMLLRSIGPASQAETWPAAWIHSSSAAIDLRSAGIPFPFTQLFPTVAIQWVAMGLMMIGACPAGTGGGIKLTTFAELFHGARRSLANQGAGRTFGFALIWLTVYVAIAAATCILLICFEPQLSGDRLLFLAISATSNVGIAQNPINLTGPGLYVLSAALLLGRLVPLAILLRMAATETESTLLVA
jgi:Trk-type K+ transport system membrane component